MTLVRSIVGPTVFDRILAVNSFGTKTVLLIAVYGFLTGRPDFLDLALVYALMNFIGTIAVMKFTRFGDLAGMEDERGDVCMTGGCPRGCELGVRRRRFCLRHHRRHRPAAVARLLHPDPRRRHHRHHGRVADSGRAHVPAGLTLVTAKLVMLLFFLVITSPLSSHALAKAAFCAGLNPMLGRDLVREDDDD